MSKFSHFLKVLRSHIFMILLIGILCGGIAASYIYYFYNPKNVTYEITFKSNENINLSLDYIVNVKNIIEKSELMVNILMKRRSKISVFVFFIY